MRVDVARGMRAAYLAVALAGCGQEPSPAEPAPPRAGQGLRLVSAVPGDGASLSVRECRLSPSVVVLCTVDLVLTIEAMHNETLPLASVFVEFYAPDGRRCAAASTPSVRLPPFTPLEFRASRMFVEAPPNQGIFCPLPVTTTRMVVVLMDVTTAEFRRVLTGEYPGRYTFEAPLSGSGPYRLSEWRRDSAPQGTVASLLKDGRGPSLGGTGASAGLAEFTFH